MENRKIDILLNINQIISEDYNGDGVFYDIQSLDPYQLLSYNNFMDLVKSKTSEPYNHIYIGQNPIKRFVNVSDPSSELKEVLYDDLSEDDKLLFDEFYKKFNN